MRWLNNVLILYALTMIVIGVQAYVFPSGGPDHRSIVSLAAGVAVGLLILGSVALSYTNPRVARIGAAVICLLVFGRFVGSYFDKREFYPHALIAILTFITLGCLVAGHFMGMLARRERGRETLPDATAEKLARERAESTAHQSGPPA